ncbi:MAG: PTS sugar transporter subunit IIA [Kiritimatiellia bacterium]|nr:PTS sugar transporter subunit IIA [Kiritimatiellia bacterium]
MPHRSYSLNELADYLHLPAEQIEELARRGEIPCTRRGGRLSFRPTEIDAWVSQHIIGMNGDGIRDYHHRSSSRMIDLSRQQALIPDMLLPDFILPQLSSKTRSGVLRDLVEAAERTGRVASSRDLLASLEERERMGSTALPGGLAIPHPVRHDPYLFDESFILVARAAHPIPFGSPDGELTDLFFLSCCGDEQLHLHLLARLCMMCHHTAMLFKLRETRDSQVMLHILLAAEEEVLAADRRKVSPPEKST